MFCSVIPKMVLFNNNRSCTQSVVVRSLSTSMARLNSVSTKIPKTIRTTTNLSQKLRRTKRINQQHQQQQDMVNGSSFIEELTQRRIQPCTTFTTSEAYDLDKILSNNHLQVDILIPNEILHFKFEKEHDVMVLIDGSVVVWGMDESNVEKKILPLLKPYEITSYEHPESEDMDYVETIHLEDHSHLNDDIILVNTSNNDQGLLDKAAFSSGLSRSTRLAILENALERHLLKTRKMSEHLSQGKRLTVTEKELLRTTGRLFLLRGKLNLYSELIEIPDLYWSEPNLEKIYRQISNNLDISPRISILNKKLDYATEESRALMSTLNEAKSTRLEWIIIYLIMIEVCFETFHFYERYCDSKDKKEPQPLPSQQ